MQSGVFSSFVLLISAIGGTAGLVGLLSIRRTNQKIKTEAELNQANAEQVRANAGVVISQAALNQMNAAIEASTRDAAKALVLNSRNDDLARRIDELEEGARTYRIAATEHHRWDVEVAAELRSRGGEITDPPPLFPPGA